MTILETITAALRQELRDWGFKGYHLIDTPKYFGVSDYHTCLFVSYNMRVASLFVNDRLNCRLGLDAYGSGSLRFQGHRSRYSAEFNFYDGDFETMIMAIIYHLADAEPETIQALRRLASTSD